MVSGQIYIVDRIVQLPVSLHDAGMPLASAYQLSKLPAHSELYDRGCDLVDAAAAIRRLADEPEAAQAVPGLDESSRRVTPDDALGQRMDCGRATTVVPLAGRLTRMRDSACLREGS